MSAYEGDCYSIKYVWQNALKLVNPEGNLKSKNGQIYTKPTHFNGLNIYLFDACSLTTFTVCFVMSLNTYEKNVANANVQNTK